MYVWGVLRDIQMIQILPPTRQNYACYAQKSCAAVSVTKHKCSRRSSIQMHLKSWMDGFVTRDVFKA